VLRVGRGTALQSWRKYLFFVFALAWANSVMW
jgi:hypothetical protein